MINTMDTMRLIAHRGNINGKKLSLENNPNYIKDAIIKGYDAEIDVWFVEEKFILGHDEPQYKINKSFLQDYSENLWIHCKNLEALFHLNQEKNLNVFFHDVDDATLTSHGYIWTYPTKQLMANSVCVMPELGVNGDIKKCYGICSDFIANYMEVV